MPLFKYLYCINTKTLKSKSMNFSYLWHGCLGHISDKRVNKFHKQGDFGSFDYESYDTCESYLRDKWFKISIKIREENMPQRYR